LVKIDEEQRRHSVVSVHGSDIVEEGISDLSNTYCRKTIQSDGILDVHDAPWEGWENDPAYEEFGIGCYIGKRCSSRANSTAPCVS